MARPPSYCARVESGWWRASSSASRSGSPQLKARAGSQRGHPEQQCHAHACRCPCRPQAYRWHDRADDAEQQAAHRQVVAMFEHEFERKQRRFHRMADEEPRDRKRKTGTAPAQFPRGQHQRGEKYDGEERRHRMEQAGRGRDVVVEESHPCRQWHEDPQEIVAEDARLGQQTLGQREVPRRHNSRTASRDAKSDMPRTVSAAPRRSAAKRSGRARRSAGMSPLRSGSRMTSITSAYATISAPFSLLSVASNPKTAEAG